MCNKRIFILILTVFLAMIALAVMQPTAGVAEQVIYYFDIRIWGAPFTLINYVILGWPIGSSKIKVSLILQAGMNVTNIVLNVLFVHSFSMGVQGVSFPSYLSNVYFY
ncbi:hypothetical protein ACERII_17630 [Evansella sp. AB-rgal1]|uniref:hypothetical protein n=1 Tax=Evansella sp. AB-rgal1 TaxID=3242696 RepID=UPI00359E3B23